MLAAGERDVAEEGGVALQKRVAAAAVPGAGGMMVGANAATAVANRDSGCSVEASDPVQDLRPSTDTMVFRLSDVELHQEIGKGFFGSVRLASIVTASGTTRQVVVKELCRFDSDAHVGFAREIALLQCLSHPHILRFLGVTFERMMLVTEYAEGGTLRKPLLDLAVPMSWTQRHTLAAQVADAAQYMHSRNIVHRDLKDTNILLKYPLMDFDSTPFAIVCDLGCARVLGPTSSNPPSPMLGRDAGRAKNNGKPKRRPTRPLTVVGSVDWMAPEVILHRPYNEMVDVFSFGVLLVELALRIDPDPDTVRTTAFGLDEAKCRELASERLVFPSVGSPPKAVLDLALECGRSLPEQRPSFDQIKQTLLERCSGGTSNHHQQQLVADPSDHIPFVRLNSSSRSSHSSCGSGPADLS